MDKAKRSYEDIQEDVIDVQDELDYLQRRINRKRIALEKKLDALHDELMSNETYQEEKQEKLREALGSFFYDEWVTKLHLIDVNIARTEVDKNGHLAYQYRVSAATPDKDERCLKITLRADIDRMTPHFAVLFTRRRELSEYTLRELWHRALSANTRTLPSDATQQAIGMAAIMTLLYAVHKACGETYMDDEVTIESLMEKLKLHAARDDDRADYAGTR